MEKNQITKEQIDAWKAAHGDIFKITVEDKSCILKTPDRKTLSYATSVATKDPLQFNEIILKNCWLGGDEEIKTNDSLFLAVSGKLSEIILIKEAALEKL